MTRFALELECFNPRPREGGDRCIEDEWTYQRAVSIHAPVKGATS